MNIIKFKDISDEEWDFFVNKISESTYLHTSFWLNFLNEINGKENDKSFLLMEEGKLLSICPLAICEINKFGVQYKEATFNKIPVPYPAIIQLPPTQRRRLVRKIFHLFNETILPLNVKRIEFYRHPVNLGFLNGNFEFSNIAEAISFGYHCFIKNTIIIELKKDEEQLLLEMSKYQRRHVGKSEKLGLKIKEYRGKVDNLDKVFDDFKMAHFKSAGRLTRPLETWNIMKEQVKQNKAVLFTASIENDIDISYLYCGEFDKFSWGFSQVNIDEFEKKYSPRHLLEWEAMKSYKRRGFIYYEVGIKYDLPQFYYVPTEKEISISQFKERYGGRLFCQLYFEKFFDKDLFNIYYKNRLKEFLLSDYFTPAK